MSKIIKRQIEAAIHNIMNSGFWSSDSNGLSYLDGYKDALTDVLQAFDGNQYLNTSFWPRKEKKEKD